MTRFADLLRTLRQGDVEFVLVGGAAATAHGSARVTQDIDVVYSRSRANLEKLALALAPLHPYLRGAPQGLPFRLDTGTLRAGLNFTLVTDLGWLDLLGEIPGGGSYDALLPDAEPVAVFGVECRVLSLDALIRAKRAAGRPRDLEALAELTALRGRSGRGEHKP